MLLDSGPHESVDQVENNGGYSAMTVMPRLIIMFAFHVEPQGKEKERISLNLNPSLSFCHSDSELLSSRYIR
jgi:hypothetical protein